MTGGFPYRLPRPGLARTKPVLSHSRRKPSEQARTAFQQSLNALARTGSRNGGGMRF